MSFPICEIRDLESDYLFISDSQEVESLKEYLGNKAYDFDSFFVRIENGDYIEVYGIDGIIPWLNKDAYKIR